MWPFSRKRARAGEATGGDLGRRGEKLARGMLKKHGLKILAVNYRCPAGEADLIAVEEPLEAHRAVSDAGDPRLVLVLEDGRLRRLF